MAEVEGKIISSKRPGLRARGRKVVGVTGGVWFHPENNTTSNKMIVTGTGMTTGDVRRADVIQGMVSAVKIGLSNLIRSKNIK